ncbi:hypothetical protein PNEG_01180 [Pneumocystis murina B123]|uniref:J domain-containing protein n=1 Tax=Pneumocystis murina (strain B123) TaxID=1069680 RepID=M7NTN3_PNEMU|nr:hypothetical protein PNEG_01180 [Pneumocystis murina B123]EMR10466.1 hypothetical protein PNEG_01180 [Pneumocystis murina B123]
MALLRSPYETLSLERTATKEEIRRAYRREALANHPDKVPAERRAAAEHRFKEVKEAYEVLYDDNKRRLFDMYGLACAPPETVQERSVNVHMNDLGADWFMSAHEQFIQHMFPQQTMQSFFSQFHAFPRFSRNISTSIFDDISFMNRYMDPFDFFDEIFADPWFRR